MDRELLSRHMLTLEREIHERLGFNAAAFDTQGQRMTSFVNFANPLCARIKANPESAAAICALANQHFLDQARRNRRPVVGECDAGLSKFAIPILAGEEFVGIVGGCGRLLLEGELDVFAVQQTSGLGAVEIARLCSQCPPLSTEKLHQAVDCVADAMARLDA